MTNLLDALFLYACENRLEYTKEDKMQNAAYGLKAEQLQEALRALLPDSEQQQFSDYISAEHHIQELELEAAFRAGLSIGLELSRL